VGLHRLLGAAGALGWRKKVLGIDLALESSHEAGPGGRSAGGAVVGLGPGEMAGHLRSERTFCRG